MVVGVDMDDTIYKESNFFFNGIYQVAIYLTNFIQKNKYQIYNDLVISFKKKGRYNLITNYLILNNIFSYKLNKKLISIYRKSIPEQLNLYSDAFTFLKNKNYKKFLITDGNKIVQKNKVKKLNLHNYFDRIMITNTYGLKYNKPNLMVFSLVKKEFKVSWKNICYIGDNPYKDFVNLNKVGALTIRINRGVYKNKFLNNEYDAKITLNKFPSMKFFEEIVSSHKYHDF